MRSRRLTAARIERTFALLDQKDGSTLSMCRELALVKTTTDAQFAKNLDCKTWHCDNCAPKRRRQLMAQAAGGDPNRFLTLTVSPLVGDSPTDRRGLLAVAFNHLVKRLRRRFPGQEVEYLAVVEETKAGEPHLHVLLRAPFIPQNWLSEQMRELLSSPIVDIRKIKGASQVVRYVAKYVTKAPAQFASFKRYWSSRGYQLEKDDDWQPNTPAEFPWRVDFRSLDDIVKQWAYAGFAARQHTDGIMVAFHHGVLLL